MTKQKPVAARMTAIFLFITLALVGCDPHRPSNPGAHFDRQEVLVSPGSTLSVSIHDGYEDDTLSVRVSDDRVDATFIPAEGWVILERDRVELVATDVGTFTVELRDGGETRDTLVVRVEPVDDVVLVAAQDLAPDTYPEVPSPMALVTDHWAAVAPAAIAADGSLFDAAVEAQGELTTTDGALSIEALGPVVRVRTSTPGIYDLSFDPEEGTPRTLPLTVVDPEAVISLALDIVDLDPGSSLSVRGVTAAGESVVGLEPEVLVDGVPLESTLGDWLFETETPVATGSVVVRWSGLMTTN